MASEFGLHSSGQNLLVPCIFIYEKVGPKTRNRLRQRLLWALLLRFRGRLYKKRCFQAVEARWIGMKLDFQIGERGLFSKDKTHIS